MTDFEWDHLADAVFDHEDYTQLPEYKKFKNHEWEDTRPVKVLS